MDTNRNQTPVEADAARDHARSWTQRIRKLIGSLHTGFAKRFPEVVDALRASPILLFFIATFAYAAHQNPVKVGLTVYGLSKIAAGAYVGYWIDRILYPYARPHDEPVGIARGAACKRRAMIVAACVVAAALIP